MRTRAFARPPKHPKHAPNMTEPHQDTIHELSMPDCAKKQTLQHAQMQAQYKPKRALKQILVVLQTLRIRSVPPPTPPQPDAAKAEYTWLRISQSCATARLHAQMELQILETRLGQVSSSCCATACFGALSAVEVCSLLLRFAFRLVWCACSFCDLEVGLDEVPRQQPRRMLRCCLLRLAVAGLLAWAAHGTDARAPQDSSVPLQ